MEHIGWEDYLKLKKIDAAAFKTGATEQYALFERQFMQMHPDSFTALKLYLINDIRRAYPLLPQTDNHQK